MIGAPIRKCIWIDVNAHDGMSVRLQSPFHFLGNPQPLLPGARHPVAVIENAQQGRVISLGDPIDSDRWRWPVVRVGHTVILQVRGIANANVHLRGRSRLAHCHVDGLCQITAH